MVWHLDVELSLPRAAIGSKGFAVRRVKAVHDLSLERRETVFFLSTIGVKNLKELALVREEQVE